MRPRIADNSYNGYKNVVYNYVNPQLGKMYMATLNQGYIRKLYNTIAAKYESIARLAKTVMNTALAYAKIEECNSGKSSGGRFTAQKDKEESIS